MTPWPRAMFRSRTRYSPTSDGSLASAAMAENPPVIAGAGAELSSASRLDSPGRPAAMGGPRNCDAFIGEGGFSPSMAISWPLSALASMTTSPGCDLHRLPDSGVGGVALRASCQWQSNAIEESASDLRCGIDTPTGIGRAGLDHPQRQRRRRADRRRARPVSQARVRAESSVSAPIPPTARKSG